MSVEREKEIGARIKRQRLRAGLTINEMAVKTGFTSKQIIEYEETGKIPLKQLSRFWTTLSDKPFHQWFDELLK